MANSDTELKSPVQEQNSVFYYTRGYGLSVDEARSMLDNVDTQKVRILPPHQPKGGEIYMYTYGSDITKKRDWFCDKCSWKKNGNKKCLRSNPILLKSYLATRSGILLIYSSFDCTMSRMHPA